MNVSNAPGDLGRVAAAPAVPVESASRERRVVAVLAAVQVAIGLGYYAVFGHVVVHLRDDVGLAAGTIGLVLGTRLLVQYSLLLPVGALTDALGAPRAGMLACVVRAAGFAVLGAADGPAGLATAAVLVGAGGALYHPAAQSLLAGLSPGRRPGGFAVYLVSGHISAVLGPSAGLALLALGGFPLLAAGAAAAWCAAAVLFPLLPARRARPVAHASPASASRTVLQGVRAVARDRGFVRFAVIVAPSTLLVTEAATVVPLRGFGAGWTAAFLCLAAAVVAAVQPWCASRSERPGVLRAGLLLSGAGFLALVPLDGDADGPWQVAGLLGAAVLTGLGQGLMQPPIFQAVARYAPPEQVGAYLGASSFLAGMTAFGGGLAVGALFDTGSGGAVAALAGLAALGFGAAAARPRTAP
ncbi:MFS transporter [Actinomadura sp. NAK00032]|uniref:MFS transporter n=1 Tax=Actinomadura sp. NAK00032 TaxID=2742128 RepID=UPI001590F36E|nr:MFS transporter [Actinomadura sp. NAK00032]QKW34038.1 MFS transporter [Actinomadura sp. NAK00032]